MKYSQLLVGAALVASSALASAAPAQTVTLTDEGDGLLTGVIDRPTFGTKGMTFEDVYNFQVPSAFVSASVSSPTIFKTYGLSFSSFNLYSGANLIQPGEVYGSTDKAWVVTAGTYSLHIAGTVTGSKGGSYNGLIAVSPVPEPETWGMTVGGLAAVGFLARRRKTQGDKSTRTAAMA